MQMEYKLKNAEKVVKTTKNVYVTRYLSGIFRINLPKMRIYFSAPLW